MFSILLSSLFLRHVEKYWVLIFYKNCGRINCDKLLFAEAPEKTGFCGCKRLRGETMKGLVKKLCDIESIVIPEEMLKVSVDPARVEEEVASLALRYADKTEVDTTEIGDIVYCEADKESYPDGRTIILYTGTELPGAKEAAAAAVKKSVGDSFSATLADKSATLKIVKIIRRTPAEINDALVAAIGIEGVSTVDGYREYIKNKLLADIRLERSKEITRYFMDKLTDESEFSYDEAELEAYVKKCAAEMPEGEPEMPPEELKQAVLSQMKLYWAADAFCKARGIEINDAEIEAEADQMAEMMGLMGEPVPDREELLDATRQNFVTGELFKVVDAIIGEKFGG